MQPNIILPPEPKALHKKLILRPLLLADTGVFLCNDFNIFAFYPMCIFYLGYTSFLIKPSFSQILIKTMIQ